jgi:tetratricopeptide (TPR) repeat protein
MSKAISSKHPPRSTLISPKPTTTEAALCKPRRDYDRAIADYSEAIRINPNYAVAYSNRGNLLQARGRREDAIADVQRALAIDPNHERSRAALKQLGAAP